MLLNMGEMRTCWLAIVQTYGGSQLVINPMRSARTDLDAFVRRDTYVLLVVAKANIMDGSIFRRQKWEAWWKALKFQRADQIVLNTPRFEPCSEVMYHDHPPGGCGNQFTVPRCVHTADDPTREHILGASPLCPGLLTRHGR